MEQKQEVQLAGPKSVITPKLQGDNIINFGDGADGTFQTIDITYTSTNADEVIFTIGKSKQILKPSCTVSLNDDDLFNGAGNYTLIFKVVT